MNFQEIQEALKCLINEKTPTETAEKIGQVAKMVETAEKEFNELVDSKDALRVKYVEAVKNASFGGTPTPAVEKQEMPKTLEECILETTSKN